MTDMVGQGASGQGAARAVRRVVIAGGGTAGWMVAALLSRTLGRLLEITLVESDEIGTVGVGEGSIPPLVTFHRLLGLGEADFMSATQGTFKLGIRFEDWNVPGTHYIHSFGDTGRDHWTAGFQHFWHAAHDRGLAGAYGDYCLELQAMEASRFAHLPKNGLNHAYHFDAGRYAKLLRGVGETHGVQRIEGKIASVEADRDAARVHALRLADGRRVEGDLFIDCTGFRALLIGEALGVGWQDWSHWLYCDSAIAVQSAHVRPPVPYTRSIAHAAGWQWRIPLQHRVGNGIVYSARHMDDDTARATLLGSVEGETLTEPRLLRFRPGQRDRNWHGNCVAIGLAGGFLEPLESTSIHLIHRAAMRLVQMFPAGGIEDADIAEFNRQVEDEILHIRDFLILHYHLVERRDSAFWRDCAAMDIPDTLRHRIALYRGSGRVFPVPGELFVENSWVQVMLGLGLLPQAHHPTADLMGDAELARFLGDIRGRVTETLAQLPPHHEYLARHCPAQG